MREADSSTQTDALISTKQLARFLGVPVTTVYGWRHRGVAPRAYRVGRHTRYRLSDVVAWLEERRSAAEQGFGNSTAHQRKEVNPTAAPLAGNGEAEVRASASPHTSTKRGDRNGG